MKKKVKPLRSKTMSLDVLRKKTLELIRVTRKQLNHVGWEPAGLSDTDFKNKYLEPLEVKIRQDIEMEKIFRENERATR